MVFFDTSHKVYRIRLNAPFQSAVCRAKIGESRQSVLAALGTPARSLPNGPFADRASYIYACDSNMSVRYDFAADDRLISIYVLSGAIPVPPVVAVAANSALQPATQAQRSAAVGPRITAGHPRIAAGLQAAGQLAPTHDLGCIPIEQVKAVYTGADLYLATRKCLDTDQFELSAQLFALAGTYGRFDVQRIPDKTVSGGLTILMMNVGDGLSSAQKEGFLAAAKSLHDEPRKHSDFCARVAAIGPPDYIPTYLISHGMGLSDGRRSDNNGLDPAFDRNGHWQQLLSEGLLCPGR